MFARGDEWATIGAAVRVTGRTLQRWHAHPEFAAEIARVKRDMAEAVKAEGIANRQNRIDAMNDRWHRMQRVIDERGADETMAAIPGGTTGLVLRKPAFVKVFEVHDPADLDDDDALMTPTGNVRLVYEYAVDTPLLKALLEHEKQAPQDLGEWTEKRDISGDVLIRQYVGIDVRQV